MRKNLILLLTLCCLLIACITPAAAYDDLWGTPLFTSGVNNDFRVTLYANPIVLKSINYERYDDWGSYSTTSEKSSFFLYAPGDGDYTITVTNVTSTGYFSIPKEVIFHFAEKDFSRPSCQWDTGREFVFRYHPGKTERFSIPDCKKGFGYELYILPKEGSATSLECYAYLSVCFDGYHQSGEITDMLKPATCGQEGTRYFGCPLCQHVSSTETIPALSHELESGVVITPATCTQEGQVGTVCKNCGMKQDVINVGKAGHVLSYHVVTKAGHMTDGAYEIRCEECDAVLSTGVIPTKSQHTPTLRIIDDPTCTEGGVFELVCQRCDVQLDSGSLPPTGHHYIASWANEDSHDSLEPDSWLFHVRMCSACGDKHVLVIPSFIVLAVAAAILVVAIIVLCIVLHKVRLHRRYRQFRLNGGQIGA